MPNSKVRAIGLTLDTIAKKYTGRTITDPRRAVIGRPPTRDCTWNQSRTYCNANCVIVLFLISLNIDYYVWVKIQVQRDVQNPKSGKYDILEKACFNNKNICKPKIGRDQVSGGMVIPCSYASPIRIRLLGKLLIQLSFNLNQKNIYKI